MIHQKITRKTDLQSGIEIATDEDRTVVIGSVDHDREEKGSDPNLGKGNEEGLVLAND